MNAREEFEKNLKDIKAIAETAEASTREPAKILYAYYRNLVKAGFSEEQALEIIKARGIAL